MGTVLSTLRVDHVGSLLRPPRLREAMERFVAGELPEEELRPLQDEAIRQVVRRQEGLGLPLVTDGEFRRVHFMESFAEVAGLEGWRRAWNELLLRLAREEAVPQGGPARGRDPVPAVRAPVTDRLRLLRNRPREEFEFTRGLTRLPVKVTLINPERVVRGVDLAASAGLYPDPDALLADVVAVAREIVRGLVEAGCPYIQLDAPGYTAYVDVPSLAALRAAGEDPAASLRRFIAADNAVIAGFPGVTFGLHVCRGNRQGLWHREGPYDAIAEPLFTGLRHHRLLLEYDSERAGGFEPLRFVPPGTTVVLGLITTKTPRLETRDALLRRIDEAARYCPVEQLALSPQCGFASNIAGNPLSEDDQWRKLERMLEVASRVWGGF